MRISSSFLNILITGNLPNIFRKKLMGIIANALKNILLIIPVHILQKKLNRKFLFVPAPLHAQACQVEFWNQYVCFVIKKNVKGRWLSLCSCEKFYVEISIREAANKLDDENIQRKVILKVEL